jgi:ribose 1,5-bisphosphokinase
MTAGRLIYVMGPSGAGKDSVIACARRLGDPARLTVAHRYITRPPRLDAENHIALSEAEFATRRRAGWFALSWHSHGLDYGVGREIDLWLASGAAVLVNGSRAYLAEAVARYPDLLPILVTASPEIRRTRLLARERESAREIAARLDRRIDAMPDHPRLVTIDNSGALENAGATLLVSLDLCRHRM